MKELTSKENKQDNQRTVNQFNNTVAPVHTKNSLSLPSIIDQANKDKKGTLNSNTIGLPGKAKDSLIQRSIIEQAIDSSLTKQNALSDNKSGSFDEIKDEDIKIPTTNETIILPEVSTTLNFSVGAPNTKYPDAVINFSADVRYVQNRLLEIGLLSENDHLNEYPKSEPKVDNNMDISNSTNELSGSENLMISLYKRIGVGPQVGSITIPKTIEAIKVFQKEVKHGKSIDGRIDLGSTANLLANITKGQVIKLMIEYRSKKRQNEEKKKEALVTHKNSDEFNEFEENRIKNIKAISSGEESVKGIIDNHKNESDLACLLRDYAEHNPTLVIKILEASDYSDQDDIVLEMMKIIDDNLLSKLSTELLNKMKESLEEGWTDREESSEIKRIDKFCNTKVVSEFKQSKYCNFEVIKSIKARKYSNPPELKPSKEYVSIGTKVKVLDTQIVKNINYVKVINLKDSTENWILKSCLVDSDVVNAIYEASNKTNINFEYLMAVSYQESAFDSDIKASSSSATGLFQFIDSTWFGMIKSYGSKYGLEDYANHIEIKKDKYVVSNIQIRNEIIELKINPYYNALMGALFQAENEGKIEKALNRSCTPTDLYLAHFLGASGAIKFLKGDDSQLGIDVVDSGVSIANPNIFYNDPKTKKNPKKIKEIYDFFSSKIEGKMSWFQ